MTVGTFRPSRAGHLSTSRIAALASMLAVGFTSSSLQAQGFEGAITVRIPAMGRNAQGVQEIEFLSRAGNVRVNMASPAGAMSILGLSSEKKTYLVIESQKSYVDVTSTDAGTAVATAAANAKVTPTGRKETIAGYECEHMTIESTGAGDRAQSMDVCITKALGPYVNPMSSVGGVRVPAWQLQMMRDGGFPLKVARADGTVELEVTKIEKRRVSDAQFRIPADFNKMDMPKRP
ncbi:MAG: DUF4412 domain-containing protein [Gemmatimonadaceae bacterium]|nr:DUF4412 domain-containing protein [Gemmatimonadaceae bacterium]